MYFYGWNRGSEFGVGIGFVEFRPNGDAECNVTFFIFFIGKMCGFDFGAYE